MFSDTTPIFLDKSSILVRQFSASFACITIPFSTSEIEVVIDFVSSRRIPELPPTLSDAFPKALATVSALLIKALIFPSIWLVLSQSIINSSLRLVWISTVRSPVEAFSSPFIILRIVVPMLVDKINPITITIRAVTATAAAVSLAVSSASAIMYDSGTSETIIKPCDSSLL